VGAGAVVGDAGGGQAVENGGGHVLSTRPPARAVRMIAGSGIQDPYPGLSTCNPGGSRVPR
jgi:poly(3-hydroxybutyrate) depolymerase